MDSSEYSAGLSGSTVKGYLTVQCRAILLYSAGLYYCTVQGYLAVQCRAILLHSAGLSCSAVQGYLAARLSIKTILVEDAENIKNM